MNLNFSGDYKFRRYSLIDGLSQNTIYSINQDKKGFIWICTQKGVNRFDGYNFKGYKNDPSDSGSLANNYLNTSFADADGNIWFGSLNGIFTQYLEEDNSFKNFRIPLSENNSNAQNLITCISGKSKTGIFISSFGMGINLYDKAENKFYRIGKDFFEINFEIKNVKSLFYEDDEILWAGTWDNGLVKIDFKNQSAIQYLHNPSDEKSISNDRVKFIFRDSREILWIGTSDGLNRFDPDKNNFCRYLCGNGEQKNFSSIAEDKNSNLWIGSMNTGLIKFEVAKENFFFIKAEPKNPSGLSSDSIFSLYSDSSNVLWIGTFTDGINKLDCERKKFYSLTNLLLPKEDIPMLCVGTIIKNHSGKIFIGTDFQGLFEINKNDELKNLELKNNIPDNEKDQTVLSLFEDKQKNLWIGTLKYGLYVYNDNSGIFENHVHVNSILCISKFNNSNNEYLWIGTLNKGLFRFDKNSKELLHYSQVKEFNKPMNSNGIKCLYSDKSGILWIGTDTGGLNELDLENGSISNYTYDKNDPNSISDNFVLTILEDSKNNIWAGTMNEGLNLFDRENKIFKRYNTDNKLPDNGIMGILEDGEGNLWLSTNKGLSKFNPEKETVRNYDVSDGLQSNEFNANAHFKDEEGVLYFGGINGFNFFKPEEIQDNPYIPEIVITDFQIFNQSVKNSADNPFLSKSITETKEIILSYKESVFSFEFSALIFNIPEKNEYAYKMEGFDKEWIFCGNRRYVTYTSLEPGKYTFRVKGSNNDGIWNEEGASVKIVITPPFWKTRWFKTLSALSIAGLTGLSYRQKLSRIEKEKRDQAEFSRKLIESQEQERKRIAKDLHDSIAHDILITKNKAELGMKKFDDPDLKGILNEISEITSHTLNDVRSISKNLHPQTLERLGLTKAIKSIIKNVSSSTEIIITDSIEDIDNIQPKELNINIFRIVQECISNMIKHSGATTAAVRISRTKNSISLIISDNGKGFSKEKESERGSGLKGISERLKLYDGRLIINTGTGRGTEIRITVPVK